MNGINSPRRCKSISKKPQTTLAQSFAYATSELAPEDFCQRIIQLVRPTVTKDLISADTVRNEIAKRAQQRDMQVSSQLTALPCKFATTTDMWTSPNRIPFMCVTGHYIDKNWDLQSALIDFVPFTGKHSEVKISEKFRLIAQESFGGFEKVLSVTCDNASNNLTFVESLISLEDFDESGHMRCFAHVINLAVKEAYKIFEKDIKVIRDLIVSLRRSSLLMEKFEEICVKKEVTVRQPCYDVPTRWNSTWEMLTYAVEYKKVFDLLCLVATGDGFKEQYRTIKWDVLEQLCLFLRKFAKATTTLSGSKYGTLNQVLPMHVNFTNHCLKMKTSRVQVVRQAADAALQKLNQYCTTFTDYNVIATVLDPRYKARFFDQNKNLLHYDIVNVDDESPGSEIAQSIVQRYLTRLYQDRVPIAEEELSEVDDFDAELYGGEGVSSDNVDNHLTTYFRDSVSIFSENPLEYWKIRELKWPQLAAMAKDFLAIPATSVLSESAFSTGRQIVTDYRGSLEPNTIRNVMVLRDVYRKQGNMSVYDFVESTYTVEGIESVDSTSQEE
ncbi:hypothetical protein MIR68_011127 [Amoeboaphelidium protococcarum]|nr:hypothetical protein MIR68_011127 [Amoeboaphelidium protococcarum]